MDLWDVGRIVIKRWYVSVPVLVAALAMAVFMSGRIDPEYSTEASILLVALGEGDVEVAPVVPDDPDSTLPALGSANPYLNFPSSLPTVAQATALAVSSDATRAEVAAAGFEPGYEVIVEARSPVLFVQVSSNDSDLAVATMDHVVGLIERDLEARQDAADVPEDERITAELLARSEQGVADQGGRSRVRLAVAGLGVLLAIGAAVAFDAAVTRRRPPVEPPGVTLSRNGGTGPVGAEVEAFTAATGHAVAPTGATPDAPERRA